MMPAMHGSDEPVEDSFDTLAVHAGAEPDARMENTQNASADERGAYARRRAELRSALARALDEERRQA